MVAERFNLGSSQPKPRAGRRKHIADGPQGAASRGASKAKVDPPKRRSASARFVQIGRAIVSHDPFSAAKRRFCEHAGWWEAGGVVAERFNLGSSRRLTLQKDAARQRDSCKLGGFIVSHDPFFSRAAAFLRVRGVVGSGRRDSGAVQSWVKPEVDPPKRRSASARSVQIGRVIVSYDPFFSREAAFLRARGVMGSRRHGSGAVQSWVKPEVDPPKRRSASARLHCRVVVLALPYF